MHYLLIPYRTRQEIQLLSEQVACSNIKCQQSQGQLNRYISELTEVDMDAENGGKFWLQRKTTYRFIGPFAVDISAPALQPFVERIFSLCGLMTAGRRNRMEKSLEMREFLKLNSQLKLFVSKLVEMTVWHVQFNCELIITA